MSSDDTVNIEQVLYRYCFALDRGETDTVAQLFSEDAVLMPMYTGEAPIKGRAAIRAWYDTYNKNARGSVDHLRHSVTNPAIDVAGDQASAECYLTANCIVKASGKSVWSAGHYRDKLVRQGGRWLISERQIHVHYAAESAVQGA